MIRADKASIPQQQVPKESQPKGPIRCYPLSISVDQCRRFFQSFFLLPLILAQTVHAGPWGPWSVSDEAPVLMMKADRASSIGKQERPVPGIAAAPFLGMLWFYQKTIGPVVSGRCPMYPTCSQYSVEAIRKHGPITGIIMTADRIIHELDEQDHAPLIRVGNRYRYDDPVRNNDFWWHAE